MKKILLALAIGLTSVTAQPLMAATPTFSAAKMAQTKVSDLSFKQVMRALYNGRMTNVYVNEDDENLESLPYIGLAEEDISQQRVAIMYPIIHYKNNARENRYLVVIEKSPIDPKTGRACLCELGAQTEFYSFKRLNNGQYQLVSKSVPGIYIPNRWGRIQISVEELENNIQPLGKNLVGSIYSSVYGGYGITNYFWHVLHLPEDDFINSYDLGEQGGTNEADYEESSPLYYEYDSDYLVLPENSAYYPIKITFSGEKPAKGNKGIKPANYSVIKRFNTRSKEYEPW